MILSEDVISTDPEGHTHIGREALQPIYEEVIASWSGSNHSILLLMETPDGIGLILRDLSSEIDAEPFIFKMLFLWERIDGEWWSHEQMYVLGEFDLSTDENLN